MTPSAARASAIALLVLGGVHLPLARTIAASHVAQDGLILHLDAADQIAEFGHGAQNATWRNLAGSSTVGPGALRNFHFDWRSGWVGAGTPADPYALCFDGSESYVVGSGDLELPELTLEAWARVEGVGGRPTRRGATLIGNDFGLGGVSLLVEPNTGGLLLLHGLTFTPVDAEVVGAEWMQFAGALTRDQARLYVNGRLVASLAAPREPASDHYPGYQLGAARRPQNDFVEADGLRGRLAIVRAYSRALSHREVLANFEADRSRFGLPEPAAQLPAVSSLPAAEVPGLEAPPVRCVKWSYRDRPVRVFGPGGPPWPYGPRWAFDGYPDNLAQPYVRNYWRTDPPKPGSPVAVTIDYRQPVAVTRYVHYFDRTGAGSAWQDVEVLTSLDQDEWTPLQRFADLPPDCPQVIAVDEPRAAPYYRLAVHALAPGATTLASREIETYYGTTLGRVTSAPPEPIQSERCTLQVRVVSPDAPCEGAVVRLVTPRGACRGRPQVPLPPVALGGSAEASLSFVPLAVGPLPVFIELHVGPHLIDRRPYTLPVGPKLRFNDLSPGGGLTAMPGKRIRLTGTVANAGLTLARDVKITWMGDSQDLGSLAPGRSAGFVLSAEVAGGYEEGGLTATGAGSVRTESRIPIVCRGPATCRIEGPGATWRVAQEEGSLSIAIRADDVAGPITGRLTLLANGAPVAPTITAAGGSWAEFSAVVPGAAVVLRAEPSSTGSADLVLRCRVIPNAPNPALPPWLNLEIRLAVDDPRVMFRPHIDWYTAEHGPNIPTPTNGHSSATRMICIQTADATVSMVPSTDNLTWGFTSDNAMTALFQIPLAPHDPLDQGIWRLIHEAPTEFDLTLCARQGDWWQAYRHVVEDMFHFEQPRQWAMSLTQMQMLSARYTLRPEVWSEAWQTVRSHPGIDFFYNFYGTTYTLPALYSWYLATDDLTAKQRAEKVVDWLLSVQQPDGPAAGAWFSQYCVEGDPPALVGRDQAWNRWTMPHAGGSAAKTLLWYWEASGKRDARVLEAARRCCDWLVRTQRSDGGWPYAFDLDGKPITDLADAGQIWCTWALWKLYEHTGEEAYHTAALRSRDFFRHTSMDRHRYEGYWEDVTGAGGQVRRSWEGYEPAIAASVFADMGDRELAVEAAKDAATWSWTRVISTRQYETSYGETTEQSLCGPSQAQSPMAGVGLQRVFDLTGDRLWNDFAGAIKAINFAADPDQAYGMVATGGWDDPTTGVVGPPYENVRPFVTPNNGRGDEYGRQVWNEWETCQLAWLALEWLTREGNLRASDYVRIDPNTLRGTVLGRPGRVKMPEERCDVTGIDHYDINWVGYQNDSHYVLLIMNHKQRVRVAVRPHEAHLGCYTRPPHVVIVGDGQSRGLNPRRTGVQYLVDIPQNGTALLFWDRMT